MRSQPPMIADELRRQADVFLELEALRDAVGRKHAERPQRDDDDDDYDDEYDDDDDYEDDDEDTRPGRG